MTRWLPLQSRRDTVMKFPGWSSIENLFCGIQKYNVAGANGHKWNSNQIVSKQAKNERVDCIKIIPSFTIIYCTCQVNDVYQHPKVISILIKAGYLVYLTLTQLVNAVYLFFSISHHLHQSYWSISPMVLLINTHGSWLFTSLHFAQFMDKEFEFTLS